jgi:hypothetical protein
LVAVGLDVAVSVALTFGQTRYRSTFEISLVLLASVQIDWLWQRMGGRAGSGGTGRESPGDPARGIAGEDAADGEPSGTGIRRFEEASR